MPSSRDRRWAVVAWVSVAGCAEDGEGDALVDPMEAVTTGEASSSASGSESSEVGTSGDVPPSAIPGRACPPDAFVDAQSFGMPLMTTWCTSCHSAALTGDERRGAPVGLDLESEAAVREYALRIFARAADDNLSMPPAGGPTEQERVLLGDWLACGAP